MKWLIIEVLLSLVIFSYYTKNRLWSILSNKDFRKTLISTDGGQGDEAEIGSIQKGPLKTNIIK